MKKLKSADKEERDQVDKVLVVMLLILILVFKSQSIYIFQ